MAEDMLVRSTYAIIAPSAKSARTAQRFADPG
jgi:hypothetical protein